MRMVVIGLLFAAVMIAGLVVVLVTQFLPGQGEQQAVRTEKEPTVQVLVATDNLKIGDSLVAGKYEWREFPKKGELPGYIIREENQNIESEYTNAIVIEGVNKGEPITAGHVYKKDTPGFISVQLPPGKRAITVKVSATTASGGFILPGDYVDILLTHSVYSKTLEGYFKENFPENGGALIPAVIARMGLPDVADIVTETILTNVRILAMDTRLEKGEGAVTIKAGTATLEVDPKEFQILTTASKMGTLTLALRSLRPAVGVSDEDLMIATTDINSTRLLTKFYNAAFHGGSEEEEEDAGGINIDDIAQTVLFGGDEQSGGEVQPKFDLTSIFDQGGEEPSDNSNAGSVSMTTPESTLDGLNIEQPNQPQVVSAATPENGEAATREPEPAPQVTVLDKTGGSIQPEILSMPETPEPIVVGETPGVDQGEMPGIGESGGGTEQAMTPGRVLKIYLGGVDEPDKRELK